MGAGVAVAWNDGEVAETMTAPIVAVGVMAGLGVFGGVLLLLSGCTKLHGPHCVAGLNAPAAPSSAKFESWMTFTTPGGAGVGTGVGVGGSVGTGVITTTPASGLLALVPLPLAPPPV